MQGTSCCQQLGLSFWYNRAVVSLWYACDMQLTQQSWGICLGQICNVSPFFAADKPGFNDVSDG